MFKLIKRLIKLAIFLAALLLIGMFVLPNDYTSEATTEINAPREKVYQIAQNISQWHVYTVLNNLPLNDISLPGSGKAGGLDLDSIKKEIRESAKAMKVRFMIIEQQEPEKIVFRIDGGPVPGIEPEIIISELNEQRCLVQLKEKYTFEGLAAGFKALAGRFGSSGLQEKSLRSLKEFCEMNFPTSP